MHVHNLRGVSFNVSISFLMFAIAIAIYPDYPIHLYSTITSFSSSSPLHSIYRSDLKAKKHYICMFGYISIIALTAQTSESNWHIGISSPRQIAINSIWPKSKAMSFDVGTVLNHLKCPIFKCVSFL